MKLNFRLNLIPVLAATVLASTLVINARAEDKEALILQLPAPTLKGTPEQLPTGPNIEANSDKAPAAMQISKGAKNVALGKKVTTSVKPFSETQPDAITDGKKEAFDYDTVEMKKGTQWVQVDLGESYKIEAIAIWHDHRYIQAVHDVIVQVSDDPEFKTGVITLFNNDTDNSSGLGVGTDREYFERHWGRVFDGKGTKARYVRGYTKGSHLSALNCWQEIEVYALPNAPKPKAAITTPTATASSEPQTPVVPATLTPAAAQVSTDAKPDETAAKAMAQTATTIEAASATPAQAPVPAVVTVPSTATFNGTGLLLACFAMLIMALGLIFALRRNSHRVTLAKAK